MIPDDDQEILTATAEALGFELSSAALVHEGISGDGLIRAYNTTLTGSDEAELTQLIYLETSDSAQDHEGVLVFRNEETDDEIGVWLYPRDPRLPALPTSVYPQAAEVILRKMGVNPEGLSLDLVAYRPGKRAVIRMRTSRGIAYMKVVRPSLVTSLHELYRVWGDAGLPVPHTLGWTEEGLLGFAALPGVPAQEVVGQLDDAFLDAVDALRERYAVVASPGKARTSLSRRRDWYQRRVSLRFPQLAARVSAVGQHISEMLETSPAPTQVTIHSDLHLGQVFVDPEQPNVITGILDIDTAGLGDPADDAAAMFAHLLVSADFARGRGDVADSETFERLAGQWRARWPAAAPGTATRADAIAATHLIAHALGGLVPAEDLIARAERLVGITH